MLGVLLLTCTRAVVRKERDVVATPPSQEFWDALGPYDDAYDEPLYGDVDPDALLGPQDLYGRDLDYAGPTIIDERLTEGWAQPALDPLTGNTTASRVADHVYISHGLRLHKTASVVIVGAGPAGIHMAAMLKKKGYGDVSLLEKTDRVGGKSMTLYLDADKKPCSQHGPMVEKEVDGKVFSVTNWDAPMDRGCTAIEMGTCFLHNGYHRVRNLNADYNLADEVPVVKLDGITGIDGTTAQKIISKKSFEAQTIGGVEFPSKNIPGTDIPEAATLLEYQQRLLLQNHPETAKLPKLLGDAKRMLKFLTEIVEYNKIHRSLLQYENEQYTFPARPSRENLADLSDTFQNLLEKHELKDLVSVLMIAQAAQGYGYIKEIPAYYGLLWLTPEFMCGSAEQGIMSQLKANPALKTGWARAATDIAGAAFHLGVYWVDVWNLMSSGSWSSSCPNWSMKVTEMTTMLPEGYNAIWKKIYETDLLGKVDFLIDDLEIDRHGDDLDRKIDVSYTVPGPEGRVKKERQFDFLIYAGPTRAAPRYIKDLSTFEQDMFDDKKSDWIGSLLRFAAYKSKPLPGVFDEEHNFGIMYNPDNIVGPETDGKWYADKSMNIFAPNHPDFSNQQVRSGIQYYGHDVGDYDRFPSAPQQLHRNQAPAEQRLESSQAQREAVRERYMNIGEDTDATFKKTFADMTTAMAELGITNPDFTFDGVASLYDFPWPYFHRFNHAGIRNGNPWNLAEAQGDGVKMPKTWYVGGSVVFESVNDVIGYNLRLLRRGADWAEPFESELNLHHTTMLHRVCLALKDHGFPVTCLPGANRRI